MTKNKKLLWSLAGATTSVAGLATFVSCGQTKFDQKEDGKLKIANTFSATGPQTKALNSIVSTWNSLADDKKPANWMPIELVSINGGYSGLTDDLNQKLKAKAADNLYNLAFNYPTIVGVIAKYNMQLDFNGTTEEEKAVGLRDIVTKTFSEKFLQAGKNIAGLGDKDKADSLWTVPYAKSSQLLTIDKPVMGYVIKKAKADGMTIKAEDAEFFKQFEKQVVETKAKDSETVTKTEKDWEDEDFVAKVWKEYKSVSKEDGGLKGYELSKDIFDSYEKLFDFAKRVKKSFPKAPEGELSTSAKNVIGIDSIAGALYNIAFSKVNGDYEKFLFGPNEKRTAIDFKTALTKGTDKNRLFEEVFGVIADLINTDTLFIKSASDYSSNRLKTHRLLFAIASTSGYTHNFSKKGTSTFYFHTNGKDETANAQYSKDIYKASEEDKAKGLEYVIVDRGENIETAKYKNYLYDITSDKVEDKIKKSGFSYPLWPEMKAALEASSKFATADTKTKLGTMATDSSVGQLYEKDGKLLPSSKFIKKTGKTGRFNATVHPSQYDSYFIDAKWDTTEKNKEGVYVLVQTTKETLQANELGAVPTPFHLEAPKTNDAKNIVIAQGPSIIGLHANAKENVATLSFLKWFVENKQDWAIPQDANDPDSKKDEYKNMSALEVFGLTSGYIVATNSVLSGEPSAKYDAFNKIAFDLFKKSTQSADKDKYAIYEDPSDSRSSAFRDGIDTALIDYKSRAEKDKVAQGGRQPESFEKFLKELNITLGVSFKR